jgi:hypothetical protein
MNRVGHTFVHAATSPSATATTDTATNSVTTTANTATTTTADTTTNTTTTTDTTTTTISSSGQWRTQKFFREFQQIQLRTEGRENGDLWAVAR